MVQILLFCQFGDFISGRVEPNIRIFWNFWSFSIPILRIIFLSRQWNVLFDKYCRFCFFLYGQFRSLWHNLVILKHYLVNLRELGQFYGLGSVVCHGAFQMIPRIRESLLRDWFGFRYNFRYHFRFFLFLFNLLHWFVVINLRDKLGHR